MQYAGRLANRGAILLWVPVLCREAADAGGRQKGLGEKGQSPFCWRKRNTSSNSSPGFIHKCTEKTKSDLILSTPSLVTPIYFSIMSFHLLFLFNKI